jgi:hypothetical protein
MDSPVLPEPINSLDMTCWKLPLGDWNVMYCRVPGVAGGRELVPAGGRWWR